ncbi:hypothetical protein CMI39_01890 [Candidatus Pacearchaeota archaeon]|jgi:hypothetical protein|nr:hypothetical protein [Candidatus Pacearchaeota archaeon]|tara:strand:- start:287 stop:553 length:267 start_codon:yes stop_codon:yes gene_type:complete
MGRLNGSISLCLLLTILTFPLGCANGKNLPSLSNNYQGNKDKKPNVRGLLPYLFSGGNQQYAPSKYNPKIDKFGIKVLEYDFERRSKD